MNDTDYIFHQFKRGNLKPFFREMYSGVMIYAIKVLGDEFAFLAEDVVQEAIITTYNRREDIGSVESWRGFMLSCVRFNAIAILRKHSRHQSYLDDLEKIDSENDSSYLMIEHEVHQMLYDAIESLPDKYRQIFELSFKQGLKNTEIAAMLGVAEITVKKRKADMISMLRDKLGGLLDEKTILLLLSSELMGVG